MSDHKVRSYLAKDERQEQLLAAALRAFSRGGYHGTHVSDIVEEAGVARGTFYLHFPGKHEIFSELVERMLAIFLAVPPPPVTEYRTEDDVREALRFSYRAVLEMFRAYRGLTRLLFEEAVGLEKGFRERLDEHYRVWHERVRDRLEMHRQGGLTRSDLDTEVTAELVLGMVERITRRYLLREEEPDMDRLVEALVSFEMRGSVA